jgi:K+-sensing histidine kinase KdpD
MATNRGDYSEGWLAASLGGLGIVVGAMALVPLRDFLGHQNVAILLLLGVQIVAVTGGRPGGLVAAGTAALSFDFFFTEPYLELVILDRLDVITTVLLFAVGWATSEITHIRRRKLDGPSR